MPKQDNRYIPVRPVFLGALRVYRSFHEYSVCATEIDSMNSFMELYERETKSYIYALEKQSNLLRSKDHQLEDIATWAWLPSTMTAQDFCSKEIQYRAGAYVRKSKFRICWIDIQMMNGRSRRGVLNTSLPLGAHVVVVVSNDQIDSFCFILSYLR